MKEGSQNLLKHRVPYPMASTMLMATMLGIVYPSEGSWVRKSPTMVRLIARAVPPSLLITMAIALVQLYS